MTAANINREFHFHEPTTLQSLKDNDKAIILALAEIYSNKNLALNCRSFTTTATLDITDVTALCDTSGGAFTLTLTAANSGSSRSVLKTKLLIIKNTAGAATVTLSATGTDTIDGAGTFALLPGATVILWSDGTATWSIYDRYETATFTPTDGSGAGLALTINYATYIRIGNQVTVNMDIGYPVTASGANSQINGLPYTPARRTAAVVYNNGAGGAIVGKTNGATINIFAVGGVAITNANLSGSLVLCSFTYIV